MKAIRRPLFPVDVEEAADHLFTEAGEEVALRRRFDLPIDDVRSFQLKNFPNWLIFYRWTGEEIELLRVKHGMMHLPALFSSGVKAN
ncbi:MAG TPA: hypothetical protein VN761_00665 [Candidatus Polarisedimenticolia bacterium]|nr:hypothetical protein [Candidatus Polarisedimenticolia bacterium]